MTTLLECPVCGARIRTDLDPPPACSGMLWGECAKEHEPTEMIPVNEED